MENQSKPFEYKDTIISSPNQLKKNATKIHFKNGNIA